MNHSKKNIDLGVFEIDSKSPNMKQMLKKWIDAIQKDDLSYAPFKKVKG